MTPAEIVIYGLLCAVAPPDCWISGHKNEAPITLDARDAVRFECDPAWKPVVHCELKGAPATSPNSNFLYTIPNRAIYPDTLTDDGRR